MRWKKFEGLGILLKGRKGRKRNSYSPYHGCRMIIKPSDEDFSEISFFRRFSGSIATDRLT